jgi:uncharacterized protein (UPF0335 family)
MIPLDLLMVMENIEYLGDSATQQIKKIYADKGYDAKHIQKYLRMKNIKDCIPHEIIKQLQIKLHIKTVTIKQDMLWRDSLPG